MPYILACYVFQIRQEFCAITTCTKQLWTEWQLVKSSVLDIAAAKSSTADLLSTLLDDFSEGYYFALNIYTKCICGHGHNSNLVSIPNLLYETLYNVYVYFNITEESSVLQITLKLQYKSQARLCDLNIADNKLLCVTW